MAFLRRTLGPFTAAWLLCQVAALLAGPAVFWVTSAEALLECTCTHGDHATCPMHHKATLGSKVCLVRSADDSGTAVVTSLLGSAGLVSVPVQVVAPRPAHTLVLTEVTTLSLRPAPPDPPPPRA